MSQEVRTNREETQKTAKTKKMIKKRTKERRLKKEEE